MSSLVKLMILSFNHELFSLVSNIISLSSVVPLWSNVDPIRRTCSVPINMLMICLHAMSCLRLMMLMILCLEHVMIPLGYNDLSFSSVMLLSSDANQTFQTYSVPFNT